MYTQAENNILLNTPRNNFGFKIWEGLMTWTEGDAFQDIYLLQSRHLNEHSNLGFTVYMGSGAFILWHLKVG